MEPSPAKRTRLSQAARRDQIVEAAGRLALAQGHLPLNLETLASTAGVSKALIYAVFGGQPALFDAVLRREFDALAERGVIEAAADPDLREAALGCALAYFEQVASRGPLIHLILRDAYMAGRLDPATAGFRDRIARRLGRLARRELKLGAKAAVAALNLMITIPEEAGRLVHAGAMSPERGRLLCRQLIESSLEALTPGAV